MKKKRMSKFNKIARDLRFIYTASIILINYSIRYRLTIIIVIDHNNSRAKPSLMKKNIAKLS